MKEAQDLRNEIVRAAQMKAANTQGDLAKALGISATYLSDILRHRRRFTPDMVEKAATVFAVSPIRAQRWQKLGAIESGWKI